MRSNVRGRDNNFVVTLPAVMSLGNWQLLGLDQLSFHVNSGEKVKHIHLLNLTCSCLWKLNPGTPWSFLLDLPSSFQDKQWQLFPKNKASYDTIPLLHWRSWTVHHEVGNPIKCYLHQFPKLHKYDLVPKQLALPESKVPGLPLNLNDLFTGISLSLNCTYYRQDVCIYSCVHYASSRLNPPDLIPTSFVKSGPLRNLHKCRQISLQQIVVNRLRASSTETSPGR